MSKKSGPATLMMPPAHNPSTDVPLSERSSQQFLVQVARECVDPLKRRLGDGLLSLSDECGEDYRLVQVANATDSKMLWSCGLLRFFMPVHAVMPSQQITDALSSWQSSLLHQLPNHQGAHVFQLRRHGRFAAQTIGRWITMQWPNQEVQAEARAHTPVLLAAAGETDVYFGVTTLKQTGSHHPGGVRLKETPKAPVSRAALKLWECWEYLKTLGYEPAPNSHFLELGYFPGGMTNYLLSKGYSVDAVDLQTPSASLEAHPRAQFFAMDASRFVPTCLYDGLVSDMNGDHEAAIETVSRQSRAVKTDGLIFFTLKLRTWDQFEAACAHAIACFEQADVRVFAVKHLAANRQEVTLLGIKSPKLFEFDAFPL